MSVWPVRWGPCQCYFVFVCLCVWLFVPLNKFDFTEVAVYVKLASSSNFARNSKNSQVKVSIYCISILNVSGGEEGGDWSSNLLRQMFDILSCFLLCGKMTFLGRDQKQTFKMTTLMSFTIHAKAIQSPSSLTILGGKSKSDHFPFLGKSQTFSALKMSGKGTISSVYSKSSLATSQAFTVGLHVYVSLHGLKQHLFLILFFFPVYFPLVL